MRFPEANTRLKRVVKFVRYYLAYGLTRLAYWIDFDGEFDASFMQEDKR